MTQGRLWQTMMINDDWSKHGWLPSWAFLKSNICSGTRSKGSLMIFAAPSEKFTKSLHDLEKTTWSFNNAATTPPTNSGNFHQKIHTFHCAAVQQLYQSSRNNVTLWMIPKIPKNDQLFSHVFYGNFQVMLCTPESPRTWSVSVTAARRWRLISPRPGAPWRVEWFVGGFWGKILGTLVFSCFFQTNPLETAQGGYA